LPLPASRTGKNYRTEGEIAKARAAGIVDPSPDFSPELMNLHRVGRQQQMELQVLEDDCGGFIQWTEKYQIGVAIVILHCEPKKKNRWAFAKNAEATDYSTAAGPTQHRPLLLTQMELNP
jgi:hypothetical protein